MTMMCAVVITMSVRVVVRVVRVVGMVGVVRVVRVRVVGGREQLVGGAVLPCPAHRSTPDHGAG